MLLEQTKKLCNQQKITIAQLEILLEFGNGTIRKWANSSPSIDKVLKIANFFNVSVDYLLKGESLSKESLNIANLFEDFTNEQKNLIKCYILLIRDKQVS